MHKSKLHRLLLCLSIVLMSPFSLANETLSLKQAFSNDFYIGASLKAEFVDTSNHANKQLINREFNSVTSANMLKWGPLNPKANTFNFNSADNFVEFGALNNHYVVGHVLFWHNQTPKWVFQHNKHKLLNREQLLARMNERVKLLSKRYTNEIHAWDVVNETILSNGQWRNSKWIEIIGEDFAEQAFIIADKHLPKSTELIYNDFGMTAPGRRDAVVKMVKQMKAKGIRVDGIGMQAHWSLNSPSIAEIEKSIVAFANTGVDVHITELDIDVLPREKSQFGANTKLKLPMTKHNNPYADGLPQAVDMALAQRYKDIFELFLKHKKSIKRVTFWGVTDQDSWLNNWPIKGRTSYPLLFNRHGQAKAAYQQVIGLKKQPVASSTK
ncbi:endo-1,4-beta-xylanase [Thalassomonas sp. M1454]|uniref:endo-1,4-beta-xylanase n=1 Tax=Thalassomonas sp. M1454 TaxID=2594477 RepID=UPI00117F09AB|nr:endo-1,4-beta-xylanase [Thalassomonas sp. M1454]TRX53861.1 endo-1,4-beta-xylanase [Thalassomonas sp. M1454]